MPKPIVHAQQLCKSYQDGAGQHAILSDCELMLQPGESMAIMGSSGCGKTTLLHLLGGLAVPDSGHILFDGTPLPNQSPKQMAHYFQQHIGFVYQFHHLLAEFNALDNVAMPLMIAGHSPYKAKQQALSLLQALDLAELAKRPVQQLSGGERQRIAVARAVIHQPRILIADEPTGNLDPPHTDQLSTLLLQLNKRQHMALVVATHNPALASRMQRQLELSAGQLQPMSNHAT